MISEFIREQKRYTREELKTMFSSCDAVCSDADIIRIIKKLKSYGIIKAVKNTVEQMNMSTLVEEDIEVADEEDIQKSFLYVFTFVGIVIVEGRVLKCYPKYLYKTEKPTEELKQILKVLQGCNAKEQIIGLYHDGGKETTLNRLAASVFLLNDYFENGIYTNTEDIIETNGMGEIHWDKTISSTYPIMKNARPYYVELQTKKRINDEKDFMKRLHECLLTSCSNELKDADLLELLDLEGAFLADESLNGLGDEDYILYQLEKEINVQFNTRKQMVLRAIEALIINKCTIDDADSVNLFGTNNFKLVWEKVCAKVMNSCLHTPIQELNIENVAVPQGAVYSLSDELISVIEKPKWCGKTVDETEFIKEADKTLKPDLISVYQNGAKCDFIIFDAKYYTIQLEKDKKLCGHPGVGDVTKQYLYQLAYREFVQANKISSVKNCFLMPTEEEVEGGVIKKGCVKMDMFSALELEPIQIRELSAKQMYAFYLSEQKFDISLLEL